MTFNLLQNFANEIQSISAMVLLINAVIHIIFAGAVAKDAGQLHKRGESIKLVSPMTWAFATLVGGVFIAIGYWFMHHFNYPQR